MRAAVVFVLCLAAALAIACGGSSAKPHPTASPPPRATATPAATSTALPTSTPQPATEPPAVEASPTSPPAPSGGAAQVIRRGDSSRMAVALTFDAGADSGYTSQILDTLSANGIVAAFGMTGRFAEQYSGLVARMANEGHQFINHTYDHDSFTGYSTGNAAKSQADRFAELDRTEAIIQQLVGQTTLPYFRPPYGDYDESVNADVGARGYRYNVMWTVDSMGWNGYSADQIVQRCFDQAVPGAIYIFHVGSQSQDGPALQRVIDGLRAAGYDFVPLSTFAPR